MPSEPVQLLSDTEEKLRAWAFDVYVSLGFSASDHIVSSSSEHSFQENNSRSGISDSLTLEGNKSDEIAWKVVDGDAGFRKYFRIGDTPSLIAVYAPADSENSAQFCRVAHILRDGGVHAPHVLAHDFEQGFLLLEDLGSSVLLSKLNEASVDGYYGEAMMSLLRIQQCRHDFSVFPLYDSEKLHTEMNLFPDWFVKKLLDVELTSTDLDVLKQSFDLLAHTALEQPQVVVHRDYHSRNLMCIESSDLGVIDFQDAVIGPVTYDLVSLLRDCYIVWDAEKVKQWALAYANMAIEVGVLPPVNADTFERWFDWMGLQRHIKVLGIFARLSLRDHKHGYLKDLPLVIHYVRSVAKKYDELSMFSQWFDNKLMPVIHQAPWMQAAHIQPGTFE